MERYVGSCRSYIVVCQGLDVMIPRSSQTRTLRTNSLPMRLYEEAKAGGGWNPTHLDFSVDIAHWDGLQGEQRLPLLAMAVLGMHSLQTQMNASATLSVAVHRHGTIEESLCHSSLVYETARFIELYSLLLEDLFHLVGDPERFYDPRFQSFFCERLPKVVQRLQQSEEPRDLVEALTLDGPLGKGVLGTTACHMFAEMIARLDVMPTTLAALHDQRQAALRQTEFATFFIAKLVRQNPRLWEVVDETMNTGFEPAVGMVREFFDKYSVTHIARAEAVTFAVEQFSKCYERLEMAKSPAFYDGEVSRRRPFF